jgi:cytosine/adenosine deaminase-related metal-dependent hydrolase
VREGRFGVGSDSNVRIDAAEELNVLEYGQRLRDRKRNVLAIEPGHSTGRALFDKANEGGAGALGVMPSRIGVGMDADIVALDDHSSLLVARSGDAFLDSWIVGGHREVVREVWVGGQLVVAEGRHVLRDSIQARYSNAIRALLA